LAPKENNVDYEAFLNFEDLGFDDYIHDLNWNLKTKIFPLSRHTSGDIRFYENKKEDFNSNFKYFKQIFLDQEIINSENKINLDNVYNSQTILDKNYQEKIKNNTAKQPTNFEKIINDVTEKITNNFNETILENVIEKVYEQINNNVEEKQILNNENFKILNNENSTNNNFISLNSSEANTNRDEKKSEINNLSFSNHDTHISDILNQQINQSNNVSYQQLIELEKNISTVNNNFVQVGDFNNAKNETDKNVQIISSNLEKVQTKTEKLKEDLTDHKDFFEKFINS
jgi:hypothetical protein